MKLLLHFFDKLIFINFTTYMNLLIYQGNEFLEMPSELHNSILFTEEELTRLHLRRGELEEETKEIKNK